MAIVVVFDNQACVGVACFRPTCHDSHNNVLKLGTPYAEHSIDCEKLIVYLNKSQINR